MVQLSRPFQAIVAALALFVLVWFVALHRPGSTSAGSGSSGAQSASRAAPHAATASHSARASHSATASHLPGASHAKSTARQTAAHTRVHTQRTTVHVGAATAHSGAAAARKQRAASGAHRTAAHAGTAAPHQASSTSTLHAGTHAGTTSHATGTSHSGSSARHAGAAASHPGRSSAPITDAAANAVKSEVLQAIVGSDLKHGRIVLLLFWNPSSSNDVAVHQQVAIVAHKLGRSVAAYAARAGQVGLFGSITRDVQVYQTPTLLIVNPKRQVTTVTGLTDAYALEQTIREARG